MGDYTEGQITKPIRLTSVSTTVTSTDFSVVATTPGITVTLPATAALGALYHVKNGNGSPGELVTVTSAVNIDVSTSVNLGATASLMVQFDGMQWRIL
jgi:hypothetical protein